MLRILILSINHSGKFAVYATVQDFLTRIEKIETQCAQINTLL